MSATEFLTWEANQERRHELVDGVVRLMAGGTRAHNEIAANFRSALSARLKGGPCRAYGPDFKVVTGPRSYRYPDVLIDCGARKSIDLVASEPTLLAEVLSPSTEFFDETDKLTEYQTIASVKHIILLSQRRPFARVWTRAGEGWTTVDVDGMDAAIALPLMAIEVTMAEIYDGVEFAPETDE
jgi:Uma2 family endonuclease